MRIVWRDSPPRLSNQFRTQTGYSDSRYSEPHWFMPARAECARWNRNEAPRVMQVCDASSDKNSVHDDAHVPLNRTNVLSIRARDTICA